MLRTKHTPGHRILLDASCAQYLSVTLAYEQVYFERTKQRKLFATHHLGAVRKGDVDLDAVRTVSKLEASHTSWTSARLSWIVGASSE